MFKFRKNNQVFLLGLGASKTGTSWMHHHLMRQPDIWMPIAKELHYFNIPQLEESYYTLLRAKRFKQLSSISVALSESKNIKKAIGNRAERLLWLSEFACVGWREETDLWYKSLFPRDGYKVVGEITPGYATLPDQQMKRACSLFPNTRVLIMMRDPVDRLWSNIHFSTKNNVEPEKILDLMRDPYYADQSRYEKLIVRAIKAAGKNNIYCIFFEEIFSDSGEDIYTNFVSWLGIPRKDIKRPSIDSVMNSYEKAALPADIRREIQPDFDETYSFVADYMGRLPEAWKL